ncbi:MAG TPA: hypothetical protein VIR31_05925 [Nitrososphaeraceae archaeon]
MTTPKYNNKKLYTAGELNSLDNKRWYRFTIQRLIKIAIEWEVELTPIEIVDYLVGQTEREELILQILQKVRQYKIANGLTKYGYYRSKHKIKTPEWIKELKYAQKNDTTTERGNERKMKIRVNNEETYEINVPEELPLQQIDLMIDRLSKIRKLFANEFGFVKQAESMIDSTLKTPVIRHKRKKLSREEAVEVLKVFYSDIPMDEKKKKVCEMTGNENYARVSTHMWDLRKKHNVQPQEVGLTEYNTNKRKQ